MKSYTDIEQSRKLAKILPLESADMFYRDNGIDVKLMWEHTAQKVTNPCWSLAALLEVLPEYNLQRTDWGNKTDYKIVVTVNDENYASKNYDNPVDACYKMIIKLHELNLS